MGRMEIFEVRRLESFRYPFGDFPPASLLDWALFGFWALLSPCVLRGVLRFNNKILHYLSKKKYWGD
jgi:hypothetical protein